MKDKGQRKIPTSKVQRASRFLKSGIKVGGNYVKHYAKKALQQEVSQDDLDKKNAQEILDTLSELKGSALKVAQTLSMERNILPDTYADIFSLAQYNAPPLSGPLIAKTFKQHMGKKPHKIFDTFEMISVHAASIGQVHKATKDGKTLAVKIQYPGVADSVRSDLNMIKPFALRLAGLKEKDVAQFFDEIEIKLLEETDYELELRQSTEIANACKHLPNLYFATYYPEYSSKRILTMDWIEGIPLREFLQQKPSQALRNKVGQALWDFFNFQIHALQKTHADPHPGNFLIDKEGNVGVIDFGCVKNIPYDFYHNFFEVIEKDIMDKPDELIKRFIALQMLYPDDTPKEQAFFMAIFQKMIDMLSVPFLAETFDFGNDAFFEELYAYGEKLAKMPELRQQKKPRGVKDTLYVNRALFGLFKLLNELKAVVRTDWVLKEREEIK